jgi:hypothetical protein
VITPETHKYLFNNGHPIDKYISFWDHNRQAISYYVWRGNEYIIQETPAECPTQFDFLDGVLAAQAWMAENYPGYKADHPDFYPITHGPHQ